MLKPLKRLLAALVTGISITPVARPVAPESAQVMTEADAALLAVEYSCAAAPASRREYTGPRTMITEELIMATRQSKRFRNAIIDIEGTRIECEKFVEERTR